MEGNPPPGQNPGKRTHDTMANNTNPPQLPADILALLREMSRYTDRKLEEIRNDANLRNYINTTPLVAQAVRIEFTQFNRKFPNLLNDQSNPDRRMIIRGLAGKALHEQCTPVNLHRPAEPTPEEAMFDRYKAKMASQLPMAAPIIVSQDSEVATVVDVDSQSSTHSTNSQPSRLRRTDGPHPLMTSAPAVEIPIAQLVIPQAQVVGSTRIEDLVLEAIGLIRNLCDTMQEINQRPNTVVNAVQRANAVPIAAPALPSPEGSRSSSANSSRSSTPSR